MSKPCPHSMGPQLQKQQVDVQWGNDATTYRDWAGENAPQYVLEFPFI